MMLSIMPDSCLLYMAHLSEIARHSRNPGGGSQYYTIVLAVLGLLVALWVCWGLIAKLRGAGANGAGVEQTSLLELIAEKLGLTPAEIDMLKTIALENGIQPAEVLLVDPVLCANAVASHAREQSSGQELLIKLFGPERSHYPPRTSEA